MNKTMFKRPSKKQLLIRRIIVSTIMVLAVLVIVAGTILFILGYRLDSDKGRLEQGALVQFESKPTAATVSIDGKVLSARTSTKQSVLAGVHDFMMSKDGYNTWSKTLSVKAGTLNWLDYIRLVPKELKSETVASYTSLYGEKASPDLETIILQEKADTPTFQLVDIRAQDVKTTAIALPATVYSDAAVAGVVHTFTLDRWDTGGRYLTVKHTYGDKLEWIILDTQNVAGSSNVTRLLGIDVTDVRFAGTNGRILYGLTNDGTIRKLDLSATTISRALVTNVKSFDLFETNVISYVGIDPANTAKQVVGIYREGDDVSHVLRSIDSLTAPLSIAATRYFSDYYVAIAEGPKVSILTAENLTVNNAGASSLQNYGEFTASADVTTLNFSDGGFRLVAQSGLQFVSYEIEYQRQTNAAVQTSEAGSRPLQWLDGAYLWAVYDGKLSMREFDGTNTHVLTGAEVGFDASLSQNGRYIYSVGKTGEAYQLQRVKMLLD